VWDSRALSFVCEFFFLFSACAFSIWQEHRRNSIDRSVRGRLHRLSLLDSLKSSFQSSSFRSSHIFVPSFPLFFFVPVFGGRSALNISLGISRRCVGSVFGRVTVFLAICFVHFTSSERVVHWRTFIYFRATSPKFRCITGIFFSFKQN